MPLTVKQREYLQSAHHRWNFKTGATGSGKSFVDMAATIPKRLLAMRGEGLAVLMGNTQGTLERNILSPMREMWGENLVGPIRTGANGSTARMFGRTVYIMGADNKKHVARIQGATIEYAYGDEVATWSEAMFQMLKSRLRCAHSHFDGTCNPEGPKHWLKQFLDSGADIYHQHYVIEDGTLPARRVEELKQEYAGTVYYQRYILGLWVAAEGAVYRLFSDNPGRYIIPTPPPIARAVIGVDFGGGTSSHAFCCMGYTAGMDQLVVLDEYREQAALTPDRLCRDFVDFVRRCQTRWLVTDVYCDSAEQTLIGGLRKAAIDARLPIAIGNARKTAINDRIRALCILMGADRFKVTAACRHTIDALRGAVWDAKHPVADVRLDDGTTNIDSLDALEYAFERDIPTLIQLGRRP